MKKLIKNEICGSVYYSQKNWSKVTVTIHVCIWTVIACEEKTREKKKKKKKKKKKEGKTQKQNTDDNPNIT